MLKKIIGFQKKWVRKIVPKSWRRLFRVATAQYRKLPAFLIIGTQKGGTNFLWHAIKRHPQILMGIQKEMDYFDTNYNRSFNYYRSFFPWDLDKEVISGEATPRYMYYPHIAERISKTLPDVKIIMLLRNPVDRAYSQYKMEKRLGFIPGNLTFEEVLQRELEVVEEVEGIKDLAQSIPVSNNGDHSQYSYRRRGLYYKQITHYQKLFPEENILILNSEKMRRDPEKIIQLTYRFLGLPEYEDPSDFPIYGYSSPPHSPMNENARRELEQFFQPFNEQLFDLLGERYDW